MRTVRWWTMACVVMLCAAVSAPAQDLFKVLQVSGSVQLQRNGKGGWTKLTTGNKIAGSDVIKVGAKSYTALLHKDNRTLELKQSGMFKADELSKSLAAMKTSPTQKFATYVFTEMTDVNSTADVDTYHQKYMNETGSVERGTEGFRVFMPRTMGVIDSRLEFSWYKFKSAKKYTFKLVSSGGATLMTREVADTSCTIELAPLNLKPEDCTYWSVGISAKEVSEDFCLLPYSEETKKAVLDTVAMLKKEMGETTSLSQLYLAAYYEQAKLFTRALDSYKKAMRLSPQAPEYRKAYALFLTRMGLVDEAKVVMQVSKW